MATGDMGQCETKHNEGELTLSSILCHIIDVKDGISDCQRHSKCKYIVLFRTQVNWKSEIFDFK